MQHFMHAEWAGLQPRSEPEAVRTWKMLAALAGRDSPLLSSQLTFVLVLLVAAKGVEGSPSLAVSIAANSFFTCRRQGSK